MCSFAIHNFFLRAFFTRSLTSCKHILKTIRCLAITKFFFPFFFSLLLFRALFFVSSFKWRPMRAPCCLHNVGQCCTYKPFNDMQTDNWTNYFTNRCHFVWQLPSLSSFDCLMNLEYTHLAWVHIIDRAIPTLIVLFNLEQQTRHKSWICRRVLFSESMMRQSGSVIATK